MAALDKSQYEEIVITSTDGSKSVDITVGVIMIDYYEDIFSPTITAKLRVVNEGFSITGDDGKLQSVYNGLPLRGGEKVRIKIKPNCPSNVGLDFSTKQESQLYVSKISSVIVDRNSESFVLHLVSREAISNETSRVGRKYPTSLKISAFSAQCKTVLGLITVDMSPAIKPFLVKEATLIILETFSLPLELLRFLFLPNMISISFSRLR